MDQITLQKLVDNKKEINIVYHRKSDEKQLNYCVEPIEIKTEMLKGGRRETFLYAYELPKKTPKPDPQRFTLTRIKSAE